MNYWRMNRHAYRTHTQVHTIMSVYRTYTPPTFHCDMVTPLLLQHFCSLNSICSPHPQNTIFDGKEKKKRTKEKDKRQQETDRTDGQDSGLGMACGQGTGLGWLAFTWAFATACPCPHVAVSALPPLPLPCLACTFPHFYLFPFFLPSHWTGREMGSWPGKRLSRHENSWQPSHTPGRQEQTNWFRQTFGIPIPCHPGTQQQHHDLGTHALPSLLPPSPLLSPLSTLDSIWTLIKTLFVVLFGLCDFLFGQDGQ